ncbi:uncharacterized protein LOC142538263 [Primulina tabacum]|uniref:uncharacterized protein LOC142538263 n=1 Tax=Primulina tabacum TaxID=48773 RepID=UPI003F59F7BA
MAYGKNDSVEILSFEIFNFHYMNKVILMSNQERKRKKIFYHSFSQQLIILHHLKRIETHASIHIEEPGPPSKSKRVVFDETSLERDPGLRISMLQHPVNHRNEIRRAYIKMGSYQPKLSEYPRSESGKQHRRFQYTWFKKFPWLEYSPSKDASNSTHNKSSKSVVDLMNVTRHIDVVMNRETSEHIQKNRLRLAATIECVHWLSLQGCGLRGHDESSYSQNRGNFIEILKLFGKWNASIEDVILDKAPGNARYTSPEVQKQILHIIGNRVRNKIRDEIEDSKFCILVDEAKDVSNKEQMAII